MQVLTATLCSMELPFLLLAIWITTTTITVARETGETGDGHTFICGKTGIDTPSCMNNKVHPCRSLEYAFRELKNTITPHQHEFMLWNGIHDLKHTLNVSDMSKLTIRGEGETHPTVNCALTSDVGSGFKLVNVSNVRIVNLMFEGCGTKQHSTTLRSTGSAEFCSAMYFLNSTNVYIDSCIFHKSRGKALSFYDTGAQIHITNSVFTENSVPEAEQLFMFGGGAILIEYTYCSPGQYKCDSNRNGYNKNNTIVINSCSFKSNTATDTHTPPMSRLQFPIRSDSDSNYLGQGGAITLTFKGNSSNNSVTVYNCTFVDNSAVFGGGIEPIFEDSASGNVVIVNSSRFIRNQALQRGGGAIEVVFVLGYAVTKNTLTICNTEFDGNSGWWGGAVAIWSRPVSQDLRNVVTFINCTWSGNSATLGAAISILAYRKTPEPVNVFPNIVLENCSFDNNKLKPSYEVSKEAIKSGVLHVEDFTVNCRGYLQFRSSIGSAVYANSAIIYIRENSSALFSNNTGYYGGAMSLSGLSTLQVGSNSETVFESNSAERGGALSFTSNRQLDITFSHRCFISYSGDIHPDQWNASITFINNTATYGSAIHVDSLLPCAKQYGDITYNVTEALRWKCFEYIPEFGRYTIVTDPATVSFSLPLELAPGERVNIHSHTRDDLNQSIAAVYKANIESKSEYMEVERYISEDYMMVTKGTPGYNFTFTLETIGSSRHVSSQTSGTLSNCPLGLKMKDGRCVCCNNEFVGIPKCTQTDFKTYLQVGYWIGCIDDNPVTAECPSTHCSYPNAEAGLTLLPRTCQDIEKQCVCAANRRGLLCGKCKEGYTVFYHSESFRCEKCLDNFGLLKYFASEVMPLYLFFLIIVCFQFNLSSGVAHNVTFFVQIVLLMNYKAISHENNPHTHVSTAVFRLIFGPLNAAFFVEDNISFCLWNGATVLENLLFKYLTAILALILLLFLVFFYKCCSFEKLIPKLFCCPRVKKQVKNHISKGNPILLSIATFFIIFHEQITVTSFQILAPTALYGKGKTNNASVVALSGEIDYFSETHLQYAIPALIFIFLFSIPPPVILFSYPLFWRLKSKCGCDQTSEDEKTCWPVQKLLAIISIFQSTYHDKCRFFSGLIFFWKLIIAAIVVFFSKNTYFLLISAVLTIKLFACGVKAPYQHGFHNKLDIFVSTTLLAINTQDWFRYANFHNQNTALEISAVFRVFLLYLPIIFLVLRCIKKQCQKFKICQLGNKLISTGKTFFHEQFFTQADDGQLNMSSLYAEDLDIDQPIESAFSDHEYTCITAN